MPPVLRCAQKNPPTVAGELFRRTCMSTSSDNVPSSASNWKFESKRVPFPPSKHPHRRGIVEGGRSRAHGKKGRATEHCRGNFPRQYRPLCFIPLSPPHRPLCVHTLWITRDLDAYRFFRRRRRSSGDGRVRHRDAAFRKDVEEHGGTPRWNAAR